MTEFAVTTTNRVRRAPQRASYDRATIYQIIDEALICHVGFVQEGQPFVIPTNHARLDDELLLHGANASRKLAYLRAGGLVSVAFTLLDGLVLARAACSHSVNYRSVVLFGRGRLVEGEQDKLRALEALSEHLLPGRWNDVRKPSREELAATTVVSIPIESASAKIRSGPPIDGGDDRDLPVWAGILPLRQQALEPLPDPGSTAQAPLPEYLQGWPAMRRGHR